MEIAAPPASAGSPALPDAPQKTAAELDNDPGVKSAITFLNDPRVKNTPLDRRLSFLRNKGLTPEQIRHACGKAGIQVTEEQILKLPSQAPSQASSVSVGSGSAPRAVSNPFQAAAPVQTQMLYPHSPPPQPEPEPVKSYDWRNVVIGTGAAVLAGVGAFKLFQRYSPFELRRKSEPKAARGRTPRSAGRRPFPRSSGSDSEALARAPPLPPAPAVEPQLPSKDKDEIKRLETELAEAKEALTNERKRAADLAVSSAKIKGEKQQLVRANDRLTEETESLKEKIAELEKELEEKNKEATPESPRSPKSPSAGHDFADASPGSHPGSRPGSHRGSRPGSRPGSRASSHHSRPATPQEAPVEPTLGEVSGIAVIDPVSATAPSQQSSKEL